MIIEYFACKQKFCIFELACPNHMETEKSDDIMCGDYRSFGINLPAKYSGAENSRLKRLLKVKKSVDTVGEKSRPADAEVQILKITKNFERCIIAAIHTGQINKAMEKCDELGDMDYVAGKTVKGLVMVLSDERNYFPGLKELAEGAAAGLNEKAVNALLNVLEIGINNGLFDITDPETLAGNIPLRDPEQLKEEIARYLALENEGAPRAARCADLYLAVKGYVLMRSGKDDDRNENK